MTEPTAGQRIAGYVVERRIGRGGMGVVYLARDERLGRRVAIKRIVDAFADDEEFRHRFAREARIAATLEHPNVVPVYDVEEHDGGLVIAMRFIDGRDLGVALAQDGPFAPERVARVISQVGQALDAAHAAGLVHRDVKPGNVLLTGAPPDEHVYVGDFGLARDLRSDTAITAAGGRVGSMDHIPPEQIEGGPVDRRADVYAVACLTYELLTGEPPFAGPYDAKLRGHLEGERPLVSAKRPGLSPEVDRVVARGMARDRDERPESAGAFARELAAALAAVHELRSQATVSEPSIAVPPAATAPPPAQSGDRVGRRRAFLLGAAAAFAVVAAVVVLALAGGGEEERGAPAATAPAATAPAPAPGLQPMTHAREAQLACQSIGNDRDSPYFCTGVTNMRAEGRGYVSDLALNDPEDGERCTARVRTSSSGNRVVRTVERGDCMVQP